MNSLPSTILEQELSWNSSLFEEIADQMSADWEKFQSHLRLTSDDIQEIKDVDPSMQASEALMKWITKQGSRATCRSLLNLFLKAKSIRCVKAVSAVLSKKNRKCLCMGKLYKYNY